MPKKFLNVLQLILISYVKQNMINVESGVFNFSILQSYFYKILGTINKPSINGINFTALQSLLKSVITPQYLIETIEQERISEFSTRIGMMPYIEDIFNLNNIVFSNFVDELYEIIFDYLKNTVQVEPYYEYFFNRKMLFWYLTCYIKKDILQNKIFPKEEIQLSEIFYELLSNPTYAPEFNIDKMRSRTVQYLEGNINNIGNLFENMIETSVEKKLHNEHIAYFLN